MAKGEREESSVLLWPTLFGAGAMVLFKIVCAVADHPAYVKIETVGIEDGGAFSVSVNARNLLLTQ